MVFQIRNSIPPTPLVEDLGGCYQWYGSSINYYFSSDSDLSDLDSLHNAIDIFKFQDELCRPIKLLYVGMPNTYLLFMLDYRGNTEILERPGR